MLDWKIRLVEIMTWIVNSWISQVDMVYRRICQVDWWIILVDKWLWMMDPWQVDMDGGFGVFGW